jgi:aspartate racemase
VTRNIGIVACSAEGAALCYRTICLEASAVMGEHNHPEITLHSIPMARHMGYVRVDDWQPVAELLLRSAQQVAKAGAHFAICPDNTVHQAFDRMVGSSPIPWLHIARVVAEEASRQGWKRIGVLGTKYLMSGPVYAEALGARGIEMRIPAAEQREVIDAIIFKELVNAVFRDESRRYLQERIAELAQDGCQAVVLGCTELPLILSDADSALPALDSTRLLARAALRTALEPPPQTSTRQAAR